MVSVTMWGETATNFIKDIKNTSTNEVVVSFGGVQASTYVSPHEDGVCLNSFDDSIITINPDCEEYRKLLTWMENEDPDLS
uniref:Replication protein A OB domain-containing protein n=1 Tax=Daphnia galeata TaxID=27404 RepID=A0A8J2WQV1_9CRUS|nr:unnamed protein product [Daphnia galeata]